MNTRVEAQIFRDAATSCYGYRMHFLGRDRFHFMMDTCPTLKAALDACDPHRERKWEGASGDEPNVLLVSRSYKQGSVMAKMEPWKPG